MPERFDFKRYNTDLTDEQWEIIRNELPPASLGGRGRKVNLRELINAIQYRLRTGCSWEMLPKDFPPKSTVYEYFKRWEKDGKWSDLHDTLRMKVKGRKRHILVDTLGLLIAVVIKRVMPKHLRTPTSNPNHSTDDSSNEPGTKVAKTHRRGKSMNRAERLCQTSQLLRFATSPIRNFSDSQLLRFATVTMWVCSAGVYADCDETSSAGSGRVGSRPVARLPVAGT